MDSEKPEFDLCVIGGGINGAGIARDAAGRGLSVLLVEAQDLAGATSSASSKLIHGGLRYLEHHEFKLVRESLQERETLLALAPHLVRPMIFVLPHTPSQRPAWMIRAGLFLYDHMGRRRILPRSRAVDLSSGDFGRPLQDSFEQGFSYSDCWVDDARLVVLNALDAAERGARVMTRTACTGISAAPDKSGWKVSLRNLKSGHEGTITAKAVINAAGPWVRKLLEACSLTTVVTPGVRLVRGSHIIVPKLYEGTHAYTLQQPNHRVVFALPYEDRYTLIGTTETPHDGDPAQAAIDDAEISYLIDAANRFFKRKLEPADILWTYSGVRPLFDDGRKNASAVTRDFRFDVDKSHGPVLLSVFGGKLTTYRALAEQAVNRIVFETGLRARKPWTAAQALPGGAIPGGNMASYTAAQAKKYQWLGKDIVKRYAALYGTRMDWLLDGVKNIDGMGQHYGDGLYEVEVRYLAEYEWARTAADVLWRRTKLGLKAGDKTLLALKHVPFLWPE